MKINILKLTLIILSITSCSGSDSSSASENFSTRQSTTCDDVTGYTGAFWDFSNGQLVAWPLFPTLQNPGEQFIHTATPTLGFTVPQGYTANQIPGSASSIIGVNVIKNDNSVIYTWIPSGFTFQTVSSQDLIASQINQLFTTYGFNGTPNVLCTDFNETTFEGISMQFNSRLLQFNNRIAQVWVRTSYIAGGTAYAISIATAPENEYENEVLNTYLPIIFQMYADPNGNVVDNDGDGWNILVDPNDNNPNIPSN